MGWLVECPVRVASQSRLGVAGRGGVLMVRCCPPAAGRLYVAHATWLAAAMTRLTHVREGVDVNTGWGASVQRLWGFVYNMWCLAHPALPPFPSPFTCIP